MSEEDPRESRRSTRLSISIPIFISGVDASGKSFRESARTLVVNKHGGKIATTHQLVMGSEILIENPTMRAKAKASVIWVGTTMSPDNMMQVGLQLLKAQNIWGIAFPPEDWSAPSDEP